MVYISLRLGVGGEYRLNAPITNTSALTKKEEMSSKAVILDLILSSDLLIVELDSGSEFVSSLLVSYLFQSRDCVPVFCPTGQVYTDTFQCIHPIKHWMVKGYSVYLRISLGFETDLERLAQVQFGRTLYLKSNWPSKWQIDEIKLEINGEHSMANATVSSIRVGLKRFAMGKFVEYSKILAEIKEHVSDIWTIITPHFNGIGSAAFCSKHLPNYESYFPEVEIPVFKNGVDENLIGSISKMHLCRRILLNEAEYQIDSFRMLHYSNKTFEYQDYDTFSIPNKYKTGVRICIEDSEYTIVSSGSRSVFFTDSVLFRIAMCVVLAVLMTMRRSYLRFTRRQREVTRNGFVEPKVNNKRC